MNKVISLIDPREALEKAKKDMELLTLIIENVLDENDHLKKITADGQKEFIKATGLINAKDASELYKVSQYQIRELAKQGIITEVPFGGNKMFIIDEIEEYINSCKKRRKSAI